MEIRRATTQQDFFMCMSVRGKVFVDEQGVKSEIEIDEDDQTCLHYIVVKNGQAIGASRAILHDEYTKLGRICVLKEFRHQHIGEALVDYITKDIKGEFRLGSQLHAKGFYEKIGFIAYGDIFIEANIQHIMMKKTV